jgi:hypothetical protein
LIEGSYFQTISTIEAEWLKAVMKLEERKLNINKDCLFEDIGDN